MSCWVVGVVTGLPRWGQQQKVVRVPRWCGGSADRSARPGRPDTWVDKGSVSTTAPSNESNSTAVADELL